MQCINESNKLLNITQALNGLHHDKQIIVISF